MSKYTTEVRFICEQCSGLDASVGYTKVDEVISKSWEKIFDFDFPIFDESYRSILCNKILKHYYTREIGFETVGLWKLKLNTLLNEIMPYYNQMYNSTLLKFDPFNDADYTKDHKGKDSGQGSELGERKGSADSTANKTGNIQDSSTTELSETTWDVYSDTPQGALTNVDNNTYLTNARKVTHDAETEYESEREYSEDITDNRTYGENTNTNRTFSNTDEYIDHVFGKFPGKSYSTLLKEFRDTFLNIDVDIIADLSDLFIKLW